MEIAIVSFNPVTLVCIVDLFTTDNFEFNLWRLSMFKRQECQAVGDVILDVNTSDKIDANIVARLSRIPIKHTKEMIDRTFAENQEFFFDVKGPAEFTTDDIQGIKFHGETSICYIPEGKRVCGSIIVKRGFNIDHPKFSPLSRIGIIKDGSLEGEKYTVSFKTKGMIEPDQIIKNSIEGMYTEINEPSGRFDQTPIYNERTRSLYQFIQ